VSEAASARTVTRGPVFVVRGRGTPWPIWLDCVIGAVAIVLAIEVAARRQLAFAFVLAIEQLSPMGGADR